MIRHIRIARHIWMTLFVCACLFLRAVRAKLQDAPARAAQVKKAEVCRPCFVPTATQEAAKHRPIADKGGRTSKSNIVETLLAAMTTEQKAGQLFFLSLRETDNGKKDEHYSLTDSDKRIMHQVLPGGAVLFGENISSDEQVRRLICDIKSLVRLTQAEYTILPFISVDQEGGRVQRIKHSDALSARDIPPMLEIGNSGKVHNALRIGQTISSDLASLGFNMDFAPVCDVFSNPLNTVIGDRAFSSNPHTAAVMSAAFSRGMRSKRIIPVAKHFPGHGDTQSDSHYEKAVLDKNLSALKKTELLPFRKQIKNGAEAIMAAHITLPQFDNKPATCSRAIITDLLRRRLGFKGVVITDAMGMKAITLQYSNKESALLAIDAGCDMLLMCEDPASVYGAVVDAIERGTISQERLDESIRRILRLKLKYGMITSSCEQG